ncbi:MAG: glycosyltransferase family 2 protein [Lachnospiraceae bacterium]|nr:glycosyltransferase family 2 protein [Candidatus Colinaster equi]
MKKCIVLIPALNEEKTIGDVIRAVPNELTVAGEHVQISVLVVDDGSTDGTAQISRDNNAYVISNQKNMGVGYSFSRGIDYALTQKVDYVVNMDADGQMNPIDIPKLLEPIITGEADMVTASRFCNEEVIPQMPKVKLWGNRKVAGLVSRIVGKQYYDVACGYRAYNREVLLRMNLRGKYTYTQETIINLSMKPSIRIVEVPVVIRGVREFGKSRVANSVLKYAWKSGTIILRAMRDYKPVMLFGTIATIFALLGVGFEVLFFIHFFMTGKFSGYLFAGIGGGFLLLVALIALVLMIVQDSISRVVYNQEEQLYYLKKSEYDKPNEE